MAPILKNRHFRLEKIFEILARFFAQFAMYMWGGPLAGHHHPHSASA
jgi:hypothetical protein